jgi:hypothetical protein
MSTDTPDYAERLRRKQTVWWKRLLPVQAPYHWNLRRQDLGRTLDVGCGLGRNLGVLPAGSVGVDHNAEMVALARSMGYEAYTVGEFMDGPLAVPGAFDGLLLAHAAESFLSAPKSAATPVTRRTSGSRRTRTSARWSGASALSLNDPSASRSRARRESCSSTTSSVSLRGFPCEVNAVRSTLRVGPLGARMSSSVTPSASWRRTAP